MIKNLLYSFISSIQRKPLEGTTIKIVWLSPNKGVKNAYIGMEGIVHYDGTNIILFTGTSWLMLNRKFVWLLA